VKLKNPDGASKGSPKKKPASKAKAKAPAKRKKVDDEEDGDEDDDDVKPAKRARKPASTAKGKVKNRAKVDDDAEDDGVAAGDEEEPVSNAKNVPELLLAVKWDIDNGPDPTGWWISEKLDGVRFARLLL
jgi:DNA ligase-1